MWKPFHYFFARFRRHWGIQNTIMDAFVTLFFLSTTKLLSVSFALLMSTKIYKSVGNCTHYDPSIKYFGKEHLPYALMANVILVFFIAFPTSLLLFYHFKMYLTCLARCQIRGTTLDRFVESFQKYYIIKMAAMIRGIAGGLLGPLFFPNPQHNMSFTL